MNQTCRVLFRVGRCVGLTLGLVFSLAGCPELDNPYMDAPRPQFEPQFEQHIQPIVRESCAAMSCHGTPDRALTLYAVGFLRRKPPLPGQPLPEAHLTEQELTWNYDALRLRTIDAERAEDSLLLRKCLEPDEGGIVHADGIVIFKTMNDAGFKKFREYFQNGIDHLK